jgi:ferric-dicitrate binding protein FerR (iron transport regulator)
MPTYDPQRARHRPGPATDVPAPVDILLDALEAATVLPEGVDIEVTTGGETIVHTADADIEITQSGDDVIVSTLDSRVEVRSEADEVIVEAAGEEIFVDTAPRAPASDAESPIVRSAGGGRSRLVILAVATVAAVVAALIIRRRRR